MCPLILLRVGACVAVHQPAGVGLQAGEGAVGPEIARRDAHCAVAAVGASGSRSPGSVCGQQGASQVVDVQTEEVAAALYQEAQTDTGVLRRKFSC